jgi:hypothetical protein
MSDDEKLSPANRRDLEICLALGLTSGRGYERAQAAETTASVVAKRLVEHLERPGFVIMRKPIDGTPPQLPKGWPHTPTR